MEQGLKVAIYGGNVVNMKTIFISQPMGGKTNDEIMNERAKATRVLLDKYGPFQLLDTFFMERVGTGTPLEYLGESIKYLSQADLAVFCPGWDKHAGCRVERACCMEYSIPILDL